MGHLGNSIENHLLLIERRLQAARTKYGSNSLLASHYLYYKLAWILELHLAGACDFGLMRTILEDYAYQWSGRRDVTVAAQDEVSPTEVYSFSRSIYERKYAPIAALTRDLIVDTWRSAHYQQTLFDRRIFVIGPRLQWRQSRVPLSVEKLLVGPSTLPDKLTHPMLAEEFDLNVLLAGEVAVSSHPGDQIPRALVINNLSGHFLPRDWSARAIVRFAANVLQCPSDTNLVAVAGDGVSIAGPLSAVMY